MIELIMFFSGWWYFSKLRKRIEALETEITIIRMSNTYSPFKGKENEYEVGP